MKRSYWAIFLAVSFIVSSAIIAGAYKYRYMSQDKISVTGLGAVEFNSDLIVWRGWLTANNTSLESAYAQLENSSTKVKAFLKSKGVADSLVQFMFVNSTRSSEPVYSGGNYVGQRFTGYDLRQEFKVEGTNVELIEKVSREISSLIASGVMIESNMPEYYYTKLAELKQELVSRATEDGRQRAEKIAENAGAKLGDLASGKMGIIQITAPNSNEDLSWGGAYNTTTRIKKASITMKLDYHIK